MEQFRQMGELLGSLKALMVFRDEMWMNQRQCVLLADAYYLAFEVVAGEMKKNLRIDEKDTKWKALESPLRELLRLMKEGEQYIKQCSETKDWWAKAVYLNQNTDCVDFHLHNLLWCMHVVLEAIENVGEISGCDQESIYKKRLIFLKKYDKDWMDPKLFQHKFGEQYLVSQGMCSRLETVLREDRWLLSEMIARKRSSGSMPLSKQESQLTELLEGPKGKMFESTILVGSKEYQVKRRLGSGSQYKEIQWMGEGFAVRHFFGDIEPLTHEISLLSSVMHPNIMHVMYAFSDEERKECFLLMELMNKDLSSYIKEHSSSRKRVPFPLLVAVDIMLQIARGMEYLHSCKIYHGDLNPENILVKTRNSSPGGYLHIKITGFGFSALKNLKVSTDKTTTNPCIWYAPEVLLEQEQSTDSSISKYTEKADVYSFGMICFQLLTGKVPFEDSHLKGDQMSRNIRAGERPLFSFPTPRYLSNLTRRCWQTDPSQRPSFSSICRVIRYTKKFLIMNPGHSQLDLPVPTIDYYELELRLLKSFTSWIATETPQVSEIPFQMFAYRVLEREKPGASLKERSSDSGSEETSTCGDEHAFNMMIQESLSSPLSFPRSPSLVSHESSKKGSVKKANEKAKAQSVQNKKGKAIKPPQLSLWSRGPRTNSESQPKPVVMGPMRRRRQVSMSDSELP